MIERAKEAVAKLTCGEHDGTAFLVSGDIAITATHCILEYIDGDAEIVLTFFNIVGKDKFPVKATLVSEFNSPLAVLKLTKTLETQYLQLGCYLDQMRRNTEVVSYGYPVVEGVDGYPVDLYINDYLNPNTMNEYDISLLISEKSKIADYSGMSGSPVLYREHVVGILIEERMETSESGGHATGLKLISNYKMKKCLENNEIPFVPLYFKQVERAVEERKVPKEYQNRRYGFDNGKKHYGDDFVANYAGYEKGVEDYSEFIRDDLRHILAIRSRGKNEEAWQELIRLTEKVRGSRSKPLKVLAELYYTRAIWCLDEKKSGGSAQKYLQKALECDPDYDCRVYHAKKYLQDGNVLKVKSLLQPIDNVSVLNTYLQQCIFGKEIEEAVSVYQMGVQMADHNTHYLMALVYIMDGEYDLAEECLELAERSMKDVPIYLAMHGVVRYWKLFPAKNTVQEDNLLPPMYINPMILLDDVIQEEIAGILLFYQKALTLAEQAGNADLQKQILSVWLSTLSISDAYRDDGKEVAKKLLDIDPYQYQAIIFLYSIGENIPEIDAGEIEKQIQKSNYQIEPMLASIYLELGKGNLGQAYAQLKKFQYKFKEKHMMEYWYELAARSCSKESERKEIQESLEGSGLEAEVQERIRYLLLESMKEYEKLFHYAEDFYKQTGEEIDLINLIHCSEKIKKWEDAEKYSREWREKFKNPMAEIYIVRCLAMQNDQTSCLEKIGELYSKGDCYITDEVQFYEIQALKILGRYKEAIEKAEVLWEKVANRRALFLLSECYFLNGEEHEAVATLKGGLKKGIRDVAVYQMLAEHESRIDIYEAARYAKKACMAANDEPRIMLWAMHFLYGIGHSETAHELFIKLQALDQADYVNQVTFKEASELLDAARKESERKNELYNNCQVPYHVIIDSARNISYLHYCQQLWRHNQEQVLWKQPLMVNFGGHRIERGRLEKSLGKTIALDFSTLVHLKHLGLWEKMQQCWDKIYLSGDIHRLIALEERNCRQIQPDVIQKEKEIMEMWKKRNLHFISRPDAETADLWERPGIEMADTVPYETARENGFFWIEENLKTDLLERQKMVPDEMREAAINGAELLEALARRGDINEDLKTRYLKRYGKPIREDIVQRLVSYKGKLPILVDHIFLRNMYELEAGNIISQKCELYVFDIVFRMTEEKVENEESGKAALAFLKELTADIREGQEQDRICFFGHYEKEERNFGLHSDALLDSMYFTQEGKGVLVCDDRWFSSYEQFEDSYIYNTTDIIELLHDKRAITDEKYIEVISRMFEEGYCYIVPPFEYMKLLIFQIGEGGDFLQDFPEELSTVCNYLIYITASPRRMMNDFIRPDALPESVAFLRCLQKNLELLLKEIWCSERNEAWKSKVSNWLFLNYSVFSYGSTVDKIEEGRYKEYYALELAGFIFSGFSRIPSGVYRKAYYGWMFQWLSLRMEAEKGLEDLIFDQLVKIIIGANQNNSAERYFEVGIGALVQSASEDMPPYYAEKICEDPRIKPILENFQGRYAVLEGQNLIERYIFNQWIDDAMKCGLNQSIKRKRGTGDDREYEITWLLDDVFYQGFQILWEDESGNRNINCFRIEGAMLFSKDKLLRMKGLNAVRDYIDIQNVKSYEVNIDRPDLRVDTIKKIVDEVKTSEDYRMHILRYILEHDEQQFYLFGEIIPEKTDYFERKADVMPDGQGEAIFQKWQEGEESIQKKIYMQLVVLLFGYLRQEIGYQEEGKSAQGICCYADEILQQMVACCQKGNSQYTLEEIFSYLNSINRDYGYLNQNRSKSIYTKEKKDALKERLAIFFEKENIEGSCQEVAEISLYLQYMDIDFVSKAIPKIKRWIWKQWETEQKEQDEAYLLRVMEYVAAMDEKRSATESFILLWDEILQRGQRIYMSFVTVNLLRCLIMALDFKQGKKLREIMEKLYMR